MKKRSDNTIVSPLSGLTAPPSFWAIAIRVGLTAGTRASTLSGRKT
jgi:hypothetical protein